MAVQTDNYAIARIDLPAAGTHGWQVRLQRRGVKHAKYFSDRSYGGAKRAFTVARDWRDRLLTRLEDGEAVRVCRRSPRNSSGVVGVAKVTVVAPNGNEYQFWQAAWSPEPGKRRCVKFSVKRYGDEAAFELAVKARETGAGLR
ncbi:MAG: AP2 domain-containing protein [Akkermansiaceae bacterium]|nr:AP2 domain-containing protein [Akkermansiaceae bacterium]NNM28824.1 AP2 domain-containing protein [Akkermansiaceae bacterium]